MGQNSKIEWTDTTWNPTVGCRSYSPGCANCYAERMSKRLAAMATADISAGKDPGLKANYLRVINDAGRWNNSVFGVQDALTKPFGWKKPRQVFVNSMSDLFYGDDADSRAAASKGTPFEPVPFNFIDQVFSVMALCPQHTFQILTKRPERMAEYLSDYRSPMGMKVDENVWKLAACMDGARFAAAYKPRINDTGAWPLPNVWLGTSVENQKIADERIPHLLRCPAAVRFLSCEPLLGKWT